MGSQTVHSIEDGYVHRLENRFYDEFVSYTDTQVWTKLAADANATVAHEGTAGGKTRLKLFGGDATDNNEASVRTTNKMFKYITLKEMEVEGRLNWAEAATSAANVAFGFSDTFGANTIADDGGAIAVTDGALIYKKDGDTVWSFHTEINNVSTETQSTTTAGGTSDQLLRINIKPRNATDMECRPFVDGQQLKNSSGVPIMHVVTLGTATDMYAGCYMKQGSAAAQSLYVESVGWAFAR